MRMLSRFFRDESAATAIEYGLIAAGIAVAIHCRCPRCRHGAQYDLHQRVHCAALSSQAVSVRQKPPVGPEACRFESCDEQTLADGHAV